MDRTTALFHTSEAIKRWLRWAGRRADVVSTLGIVFLYSLGLLHWTWFFHRGHLTFQAYDWPKEAMYFEVLRDALVSGKMPYHIAVPPDCEQAFTHLQGGRFLGLPETLLSPQILLLPWLKTGRFILLHVLLLYTLGFVGSLMLRHRYRLGFVAFATWFFLFNFNGYIVAHLAAGHSMWSGYLLLPFVVFFLFQIVEQPELLRPAFWLALTFFVMLLQGSFHLVMWCWMFVGILVLTWPSLWKQGLISIGLSGFMAAFRLIPAAITYWGFHEYFFLGGYPTPATLAEAMQVIRDPEVTVDIATPWTEMQVLLQKIGISTPWAETQLLLHWWEYDLYVGLIGLAVLGYFGIVCRWRRGPLDEKRPLAALDIPMAVMATMSLSYIYWPIYRLPLPLLNSERVASRFIVVPFVMLLGLACLHMNKELKRMASSWLMAGIRVAGLSALAVPLFYHSHVWLIHRWELRPVAYWIPVQAAQIIDRSDPIYIASIWVGLGVSLLAIAIWTIDFLRLGRNPAMEPSSLLTRGDGLKTAAPPNVP